MNPSDVLDELETWLKERVAYWQRDHSGAPHLQARPRLEAYEDTLVKLIQTVKRIDPYHDCECDLCRPDLNERTPN